ncbi:cutinase-domain-containing protein [Trichodelitschia bisporula]|uniref:Cutinase n=1 Tax=Trichodelitschia bisporula TaxID=703511 RepID=A0A6G1HY92_9PEZI|nr:cutinase-domain-containing protein [Trichodelitschia bisporula]
MKFSVVALTALVATVSAAPAAELLEKRQQTANDLISGQCKKVTLVFARASTEPGNMLIITQGMSMGPAVCSGLKQKFGAGNVACQGVGGAYSAGLMDNVTPAGTTAGAIAEATKMFTTAASKCPQTTIVAGGYSQGTAVMMNAISKLPEDVKNRVVGVVLFGYTKNGQQKSGIPNYPKDRVSVYCSASDGVCGGQLMVTAGHFSYMGDGSGPKATAFLTAKINAGPGGGGSAPSSGSDSGESAPEAPAAPAGKGAKGKGMKGGKGAKGGSKMRLA